MPIAGDTAERGDRCGPSVRGGCNQAHPQRRLETRWPDDAVGAGIQCGPHIGFAPGRSVASEVEPEGGIPRRHKPPTGFSIAGANHSCAGMAPRDQAAVLRPAAAVAGAGLALAALAGMWLLLLTGCSFEPPLHVPPAPKTSAYVAAPKMTKTAAAPALGAAGAAQRLAYGRAVAADWWVLFLSPSIDALVRRAVAHSPTLTAAEAVLEQAHQNLKAVQGVFLPQVTLNPLAERERQSGAAFGGKTRTFTLYTGTVNVTYAADIFGLNRMVTRSLKAQEAEQRYGLQEAYLTLEGNTVATAIDIAALEARIHTTRRLIASQRHILNIVRQQYRLGAVTYLDVENQKSQLAATEATLPPLEQSLDAARHALAILLGTVPSQARLPQLELRQVHLPRTLPVSLPSTLVRQRPDIRSAEAQIAAANAQVGEAIAQMYPLVELSGDAGFENGRPADFFNASSLIWNLAASATVTLFDGGTLQAKKRAAQAALRAIAADYESTVLNAFQQVADALRAIQHDAQTLHYDQQAYAAAHAAYALAQRQYQAGAVAYVTLLNTEVQYETSRLALAAAQGQRYTDTAALFTALGGGWWPKKYAQAHGAGAAGVESTVSAPRVSVGGNRPSSNPAAPGGLGAPQSGLDPPVTLRAK